MMNLDCRSNSHWLTEALEQLRQVGFAVIEGVLDEHFLEETRRALYNVQVHIRREVGDSRLARAGEINVLRLMLKWEPHFFRFLELPPLLAVVDATVSVTAIMHLQNGFILPSFAPVETPKVFQNAYHMDFPRVLNGYLASVNMLFAVDAFREENGGTRIVPGTHQRPQRPEEAYLEEHSVPVECAAGAMVLFDSTLYHAAGANVSGVNRLSINHQFTRSFIKQQVDYVRALGDEAVLAQPPRTQQLLGWYSRVMTSLEEYYQPEDKRLYRKGQG